MVISLAVSGDCIGTLLLVSRYMSPKNRLELGSSPYILLTLAMLFWSGNFILGRGMRADIPPVALAFWRWFFASSIAIFLAMRHIRKDWLEIRKKLNVVLLLSLLGVTIFNTLVYSGLQWTLAVNALLMQSVMPVIIVLISFLLYKEKVNLLQVAGIILSLLGVVAIIGRGDFFMLFALDVNQGDLLVFMAVVAYALYSVILRKRPRVHPLSFIAVTFSLGTLILLPFYIVEFTFFRTMTVDFPTVVSIGYVAIFPSIVSFLCFNRGVELVGANRAGMFIHLMPVFGSIMAILFLEEALKWFHVVGILLIGCGIFLTNKMYK